ncbi:MAG: L,D-transpeptidase family protein [Solirubrobacteraceae bacterium]
MRIRTPFVAFLAVLALGAGGLYLYDDAREDIVAAGVTVNGVDLGGLTAEGARSRLKRTLMGPVRRPVVVEAAGRQFTLSARRARVAVNVDAMVNDALRRGRAGNVLTRTWRALTGEEAQADLRSTVTFSKVAVDDLVDRVEAQLTRPARDAAVVPSPIGLTKRPERSGLALGARRLRRDIEWELTSPSAGRRVRAQTRRIQPNVTTRELAGKYPTYLTVSKDQTRLRLWRNLELSKTYDVAVGMPEWPTPNGLFSIQSKQVDPAWSVPDESWAGALAGQVIPGGDPDNPLKSRWMGFSGGAGIHGTADVDSLGTAASHGCIRMLIADVVDLYERVEVGTPIFVG